MEKEKGEIINVYLKRFNDLFMIQVYSNESTDDLRERILEKMKMDEPKNMKIQLIKERTTLRRLGTVKEVGLYEGCEITIYSGSSKFFFSIFLIHIINNFFSYLYV